MDPNTVGSSEQVQDDPMAMLQWARELVAASVVGSEKVLGEDSGVRWVVAMSGPDNQLCCVCVLTPKLACYWATS